MHHSGETLLISFYASSFNMGHFHILAMTTILAPWRANQKNFCVFCFNQSYAILHEQNCLQILEVNLGVPMTSRDMKSSPPSHLCSVLDSIFGQFQ